MFLKSYIDFFFAMLIALGLLLSPFSMKHSFSIAKSVDLGATHCLGSEIKETLNDVMKISKKHQNKSDSQTKKLPSCCVAACSAMIVAPVQVNFNLSLAKSELIVAKSTPLFGMRVEGFVRPPIALS